MNKLTPKQEGFCLSYIETGNASEAYRLNYSAENMSPTTIFVKASELLNNGKVAVRLTELQQHHQERHDITVDSITDRLTEAEKFAYEKDKPSAAVSAIMGIAKIHGLITDKQESKVTSYVIERVDYSNARKNPDTV